MAKANKKKPGPAQKKSAVSAVAKKPTKTPVKKAKALPKKAAPAKPAAPAKKPAVKKAVLAVPVKKAPAREVTTPVAKKVIMPQKAPAKRVSRKPSFSKTDLKQFQLDLIALRDRIIDQSGSMKSSALQRTDEFNVEEDGTDAFMRLQTLGQVGTQQSIITEIDEALHAISKGTYGICDACGELISKARLAVLPFARNCITCQSEMERSDRHGRFR